MDIHYVVWVRGGSTSQLYGPMQQCRLARAEGTIATVKKGQESEEEPQSLLFSTRLEGGRQAFLTDDPCFFLTSIVPQSNLISQVPSIDNDE